MTKPMIRSAPGFRGDLDFLSNFYPSPLLGLDGKTYPTAEHAYQAMKTADPAWRENIRLAPTPALAKRLGRKAPLRPEWSQPHYASAVMYRVLVQKFSQHPDLARRLYAVQGPIVERNTWHDTTWGVCVCERHQSQGANQLGRHLEAIRKNLHMHDPEHYDTEHAPGPGGPPPGRP